MRRAVALVGFAVAAVSPAAASTPMVVTFATWLRSAPSEASQVIDELPGGWRVNVLGCEAGWCRVLSDEAPGYVQQALLAAGPDKPLQPKPGAACITGTHQTFERAIPLKICPAE